ncbi:glycosyltransferase [uncultured Fusobacterium sp.]|uniref:glycosyltransferase n=1 Tax=uncultured Fusobacterium sp. TaxID=159267 RepID=UPI0027DE4B62|nr:glycosyltransferase [uncultured Fusobacterium sp.]
MEKILFISSRLEKEKKNGAYLVAKRNLDNLKSIFKEVHVYKVSQKNIFLRVISICLFNRLESSSIKVEREILEKIKKNKYTIIFLDGSGYGYLSEKIKKNFPNIKIIVFCHDINFYLYSSIISEERNFSRKLKAKKEKYNSEINENKIFKNADKIITLNKRDTKLLKDKYGYNTSKEIGVTFKNEKVKNIKNNNLISEDFTLLFVGVANFIPNLSGLEFFIQKVLPELNAKLIIVGKGMEKYKKKFEKVNEKVNVIGTVENLEEYYLKANAVVAPIFIGGGMKIKTGEALMYGKSIFGTTEAFQGYEVDYEKIGGRCNTAEEFILKINDYIKYWENNGKFEKNKYSEEIFIKKYSYDSSIEKFKKLFDELKIKKDKKSIKIQ